MLSRTDDGSVYDETGGSTRQSGSPDTRSSGTSGIPGREMTSERTQIDTSSDLPDQKPVPSQDRSGVSRLAGQISTMTTAEKIGQLIIAGYQDIHEGTKLVRELSLGGVILFRRNIHEQEQTLDAVRQLQEAVDDNLPPLFVAVDQEGGRVTRLPESAGNFESAQSLGEQNSIAAAAAFGIRMGETLKSWGFNVNFAPVLDIASNPANQVIGSRAYGSTASQVTRIGMSVMQGLEQAGMIPVVKHFPGHGGTSADSHTDLPYINRSQSELAAMELIPFQAAIDRGVQMIMVAHLVISQMDRLPASLSPVLVDGLLRGSMGFQGLVITDDLTMGAITGHFDIGEAAVMAVLAGCDLVLVCHEASHVIRVHEALLEALEQGRISMSRVDLSLMRILRVKDQWQASPGA